MTIYKKDETIDSVISTYHKHNTEHNKGGRIVALYLPDDVSNIHPRMSRVTIGNTEILEMYRTLGSTTDEDIIKDLELIFKETNDNI